MKFAIMQLYFFPYIIYFQLIANTDRFIFFFDIVQYNKKSWMNRNRVLHANKLDDFLYISVPVIKHNKGSSPLKEWRYGECKSQGHEDFFGYYKCKEVTNLYLGFTTKMA